MTLAQSLLLRCSNPGETEFIPAAADLMMTDSPPKKKQRQSSPDQLSEDEELISNFANTLDRLYPRRYLDYPRALRRFSKWLSTSKKKPITGRIDDDGLTDDAQLFKRETESNMISGALTMLRRVSRAQAVMGAGAGDSQRVAGTSSSAGAQSSPAPDGLEALPAGGLDFDLNAAMPDDWLMSHFASEAWHAGRTNRSVAESLRELRRFSHWRLRTGKPAMASQLGLLAEDAKSYAASEKVDPDAFAILKRALKALREVVDAEPPTQSPGGTGVWRKVEHADDNDLFLRFKAATDLNLDSRTPGLYARKLRGFSDWLYHQKKESVSRRLYSDELMEEAKQYEVSFNRMACTALRKLRDWLRGQPGSSAVVGAPLGGPEQVPAQSRAELLSSAFGGRRAVVDYGYAVGMGWLHGRQPAPMTLIAEMLKNGELPTPFQSTNLYIHGQLYTANLVFGMGGAALSSPGSGGVIMLNPQIGPDPRGVAGGRIEPFRRSAAGASSSAWAGESSSTYSVSAARHGLGDFGLIVGPDWDHSRWDNGGQQIPDYMIGELNNGGELPSPHRPTTEFYIHGERYTAELRDAQRDPNRIFGSQRRYVVYLVHHSDRPGTELRLGR
ncbi:hypothetical protein [Bradyrhizobium sp. CCBAU 11386]|uniref:hypothetical protein n=1 Tax=Bradyrhizobium sp. CCBAU 11386 TaxID=1630837 RepID=UPI00230364AD|nr:hypothetical protein [Bradyrhizobium sp. CCBAU 11386]